MSSKAKLRKLNDEVFFFWSGKNYQIVPKNRNFHSKTFFPTQLFPFFSASVLVMVWLGIIITSISTDSFNRHVKTKIVHCRNNLRAHYLLVINPAKKKRKNAIRSFLWVSLEETLSASIPFLERRREL